MKPFYSTLFLLLTVLLPFFSTAQFSLQGETKVNTYNTNHQFQPTIASNPAGRYVVAWTDYTQDGSESGVYARVYDADGVPGNVFLANTTTDSDQMTPSAAMADDGSFVLAWTSTGQDGSADGVYVQRFDASGNKVGSEILVNQTTTANQNDVSIACDEEGSFTVTWTSYDQASSEVWARRFYKNGQALGNEFQVNTTTLWGQLNSTIAMDNDRNFVITWQSMVGSLVEGRTTGNDEYKVFAQRYNASGAAQGSEFQVNTYVEGHQMNPAIAMSSSTGNFIIVWQSATQDGSGFGIYAQRYLADGSTNGNEFRVNTTTAGDQSNPAVTMDAGGNFIISWDSDPSSTYPDVMVQAYENTGAALGIEFTINTMHTNLTQEAPAIACSDLGAMVVWQSEGPDVSGFAVAAQQILGSFPSSVAKSQHQLFQLYPNPATEELFLTGETNAPVQIELYNAWGIKVLEKHSALPIRMQIPTSVAAGVYTVRISDSEDHRSSQTLILK